MLFFSLRKRKPIMHVTYRNEMHRRFVDALDKSLSGPRDIVRPPGDAQRMLMLELVNKARGELGKTSTTEKAITTVENTALGHVDYVHKFALRCLFLVEEP